MQKQMSIDQIDLFLLLLASSCCEVEVSLIVRHKKKKSQVL